MGSIFSSGDILPDGKLRDKDRNFSSILEVSGLRVSGFRFQVSGPVWTAGQAGFRVICTQ